MVGCQPQRRLELHYRPAPGAAEQFAPSRISVTPAGDLAVNRLVVGTVFDPNDNVEKLFVVRPPDMVARVVAGDLDHIGLKATISPAGGEPPYGIDYVVSCSPEGLSVVKRIDKGQSSFENSFVLEAKARLRCALFDRSGKVLLSGDFTGTENDPPLGAATGGRLISDPAEALSAAVSGAIDAFVNDPTFRRALPGREKVSTEFPAMASGATSSATPASGPSMPSAKATP